MSRILIGICSNGSGCGKTTAATHLCYDYGFTMVRLSAPFKLMLAALFKYVADDPTTVEAMISGDLKDTPIPKLGHKTPRELMISLGNGWGRGMVAGDIWLNCVDLTGDRLVLDDIRQPNEADWLKRNNGILIYIQRDGAPVYEVDGLLRDIKPDHVIQNDSDIATLNRRVVGVLGQMLKRGVM